MEVPGKEQTTDKVLQVLKVSIHLKSKDYGIKSFIVCYMQNIKSDADNSFVLEVQRRRRHWKGCVHAVTNILV